MASKYQYDKLPRFKRQASALDFSSSIGGGNKHFYGNLVTSCSGRSPCYSKFSKLLLNIQQYAGFASDDDEKKQTSLWSDDDRMTIRGALWTKSEKLRIYFISLLENTDNSTKYKKLYDNLSDEKYKISDDKADFILNQFLEMVQNNDDQLLQCLATYTCTQQSRPLWDELQSNTADNDDFGDQNFLMDKVDSIRSSPFYKDMVSSGYQLDDNEILAIYVYSANDEFAVLMQKHLKIPCKWKQTFYYFVRGILKIYDAKVYKQDIEKLPSDLYHPVFLTFNEITKPLRLLGLINCTSSKSVARDFAPPDGSMFVLKDCAKALSNGDLIAAPISWASLYPNENEWVLLPTTFLKCDKPQKYVHNAQLINVIEYKSLNPSFFGVDVFTKLSKLKLIKDLQAEDEDELGDEEETEKDIEFYKKQCESLQAQLNAIKTQMGMDKAAEEKDEEKAKEDAKKKDIKIPFKKIEDEAYLIQEGGKSASMCVTSCDGELNPPFISAKGINWLKANYDSNELDIYVDTYAKCGTTVGIKMIYKILEANNKTSAGSNKEKLNDPWNAVPWIEVDVSQQLLSSPSPNDFLSLIEHSNKEKMPRIWKTHAPFINFPAHKIGENTKILHIIRNPKDVVCSYYDFFRQEPMVAYKGSFNTLFDWYCDGSVVHSSIFDFELNWFRAQRDGILSEKQLLIISYEDIVRKPLEIIKKVSIWLGYKMDDKKISDIADAISFKRSKQEAQAQGGSDIAVIVNKGKIGRWKNILTKQQSDRMDRIMAARLKDSGIEFQFE